MVMRKAGRGVLWVLYGICIAFGLLGSVFEMLVRILHIET